MRSLSLVRAVTDFGLEGDRHGRPGSTRQVLMVEGETLEALRLLPGEVRENIATTGVLLRSLVPGTRLKIGSEAVLEVTKGCDPCARMEEIRSGLSQALEGRRGTLARVLRGGTICVGDPIEVQSAPD
ncbi:MAG: MOSC domain-containing protein [Acidobacteria bacterium]|nr:MOSC domain-containing protein [Acidobacteriota bacterium]